MKKITKMNLKTKIIRTNKTNQINKSEYYDNEYSEILNKTADKKSEENKRHNMSSLMK